MSQNKQVNGAFVRALQIHRNGEVISDLSDALAKVTEGVMQTGRAGSVTLKLNIKQASAGVAIVIEDDIKTVLPKSDKVGSLFFAHPETFELMRDNPNQMSLELKAVDGGQQAEPPLKQVATAAQ
jgi:hypothetical protein